MRTYLLSLRYAWPLVTPAPCLPPMHAAAADSSNGFKPFNVALDLMTFAHELFSAPTSSRTAQIAEADPNLTDLLTVSGTENAAITTLAAR